MSAARQPYGSCIVNACHGSSVNGTTTINIGVQHTYLWAFSIIMMEEKLKAAKTESRSERSPTGTFSYTACR
jgi:hypothetical protein